MAGWRMVGLGCHHGRVGVARARGQAGRGGYGGVCVEGWVWRRGWWRVVLGGGGWRDVCVEGWACERLLGLRPRHPPARYRRAGRDPSGRSCGAWRLASARHRGRARRRRPRRMWRANLGSSASHAPPGPKSRRWGAAGAHRRSASAAWRAECPSACPRPQPRRSWAALEEWSSEEIARRRPAAAAWRATRGRRGQPSRRAPHGGP